VAYVRKTTTTSPIRSIFKHSADLAQACVDAGALDLVHYFDSFDPKVRESAASALGPISTHQDSLAQAVADAIQHLELALRCISVSSLGDIAKVSRRWFRISRNF
jgi:hypothetical protein